MSSKSGIVFIIGGGPRIGMSVAEKFVHEGYKVAVGRRTPDHSNPKDGLIQVVIDVTSPESIRTAFKEVHSKLGVPNVVVYNAANLTFPSDMHDPFAVSADDFERDTKINLIGAYVSLQEATRLFRASGDAVGPKVFIATGNVTPFQPMPSALTLSAGKAALANLVEIGIKAYGQEGVRFYFASQVTAGGGPVPFQEVSGEAHGSVYFDIVERANQGPWDLRFLVDEAGQPSIISP